MVGDVFVDVFVEGFVWLDCVFVRVTVLRVIGGEFSDVEKFLRACGYAERHWATR